MMSITLRKLTKQFGETTIIPSLDLEIGSGEFISLLGPSGCGKTTLIRMIAGLEHPSSGMIALEDEVVFQDEPPRYLPPEKRNIGMVFQNYALWPHLSIGENIAFPLECRKISRSEITDRTRQILDQVQLQGLEARRPHELSGGQQQRAALARALIARPKVVLLDEPLSNLDTHLREEMCDLISEIKKANPITMIYVTHDQKEAYRLSDRIAVIHQGKIEQLGTWQELTQNPRTNFVKSFIRM